MDKELIIERFDQLLNYLPDNLKKVLIALDPKMKISAEEIRLRANRPLTITVMGSQFFVLKNGTCMLPREDCITVTVENLESVFYSICHHSVYSHNDSLCEGYISLSGGHRAGVCGRVVLKNDNIETVRDISSINLRIAKEVPHCADKIIKNFNGGGILICGGPGTGKTTLLRDIARNLASGCNEKCLKVSVIDTRGEIAAVSKGIPGADIGSTADIITGIPKPKGIEIALRTLYPDIIIFDELGDDAEVAAAMQSFNSGVTIITSAHAGNLQDVKKRKQIMNLLNSGSIENVVICKKGFDYTLHPVEEILSVKELVAI